ncbi:transcriptional regulation of mitochondrial recombination-domain-containing protein [Dichotomopilus funicola]|uniref:Large ribosomal subunit protein mL67 n=1 Tax=Dichotomopilus funicola TaxID=1934379 RepID=A0AAN6V338_9PEZI|nr:transcriptional regulation of mitochondrial recombination-domain-containing protein [Dichotomopilus funicola]
MTTGTATRKTPTTPTLAATKNRRCASTQAAATSTPTSGESVPAPVEKQEFKRSDKPGYRPRGLPPPRHAERIYIHNHMVENYTVFSMNPHLNPTKAFRQFAYTGKKLVPAKLRRDYWNPLAVIEFEEGRGDIGRSVYQKLREFQKRHQLEWEDPALLAMSREERGHALNDQRANCIADLAAVLAGAGKANRMAPVDANAPADDPEDHSPASGHGRALATIELVKDGVSQIVRGVPLNGATVYWANEQDKYFASEWTDNVTHVIGLPVKTPKRHVVAAAAAAEKAAKEAAAAQEGEKETAVAEGQEATVESQAAAEAKPDAAADASEIKPEAGAEATKKE